MERLSLTPFGRQPVSAGLLATQALASASPPVAQVEKWALFRALCTARKTFHVSDRDLTVLAALLSFLPQDDLEDGKSLVVFPSNKSLSQRAHGMAESTLRRHLATLSRAGLLLRQDSPNGKRYARRDESGDVQRAFGFDLRPLLVLAQEINTAAKATRRAENEKRLLRESCMLRLRDAIKLHEYGRRTKPEDANWDALDDSLRLTQRYLRRQLTSKELAGINDALAETLATINAVFTPEETAISSGKDAEIERHHQNSNTEVLETEQDQKTPAIKPAQAAMPVTLVKQACRDLETFGGHEIKGYPDIIRNAENVAPMLGIKRNAWQEACKHMGAVDAAVTVGFILQRAAEINSPGGYLRFLTRKSASGKFSTGPLVMALLNREEGRDRNVDSCQPITLIESHPNPRPSRTMKAGTPANRIGH